jgi:hypothetical protein
VERRDDLVGPGPVAGQPEPASSAAAAEPGGNVRYLEPQQLRLDDGQVTVRASSRSQAVRLAASLSSLRRSSTTGRPAKSR